MLWFICFFNYADRTAISAVLPALEEQYGFTKTEQGRILSAFMWVYALTAPFAGLVVDRFARKRIILAGLYVWSIVTGFTALCTQVWHFVLVRGAEGLGETFYFPASMSLVSDYHDRRTRSRAMGLHQTSVYAGTIGGGALAGLMAQYFGWRMPFVIFGVAGCVLGLVLAWFIREPVRDEAERTLAAEQGKPLPPAPELPAVPWRELPREILATTADLGRVAAELSRRPTALVLMVGFIGANCVAMVFLGWMPTFLKEKYQMNLAMSGFSATFFIQIASMFGAVVGGTSADAFRKRSPGGRIIVQSMGLLCGAPFIFLCGWTQQLAVLIPSMACFGFFKGIYDANIWAGLYDFVPAARRGSAVGLMNMLGWVGGAVGVGAIGYLADAGVTLSTAIASTAVIYALVAAMLFVVAKTLAPRDAVGEVENTSP
jgi:MFS family permease